MEAIVIAVSVDIDRQIILSECSWYCMDFMRFEAEGRVEYYT